MHNFTKVVAAVGIGLASLLGYAERPSAAENPITAIDIALEPDATMIQRAEAANSRLLKVFPKGFALDETNRPHITLLQRYVRTADLDKVYAAVGKVLDKEKAASWNLKALKFYYIPWRENGLAGIVVAPTTHLIKLQARLIRALARYTTKRGTAAAFAAPPEDPEINQPTIDYVATFVPKATGERFNPHVTVGMASQDYLKQMLAEPFDLFTFTPAGAALYQLGNFGTARKQLKAWELKP
jgi:2'-5' RNA ligase